jgi:hypothetical protein
MFKKFINNDGSINYENSKWNIGFCVMAVVISYTAEIYIVLKQPSLFNYIAVILQMCCLCVILIQYDKARRRVEYIKKQKYLENTKYKDILKI